MQRTQKTLFIGLVLLVIGLVLHFQHAPTVAEDGHAQQQRTVAVLTSLEDAFSSIAQQTRPAVVSVLVEKRVTAQAMQRMPFDEPFFHQFFGAPGPSQPRRAPETMRQMGAGSGVVVDAKGYILTNNHVVEGADKVIVVLSDAKHTQLKATVVGTDPRTDLAVLKVDSSIPLSVATLGNSDNVRVGQWAIAIGNQLGEFDSTLTVGVVSATGRRLNDLGEEADYHNLIQTDAAINPGNSGGPLVNVRGEVIGINTAIASPNGGSVGIGFAIPVNTAKQVMQELIAHGKVERGYLGVHVTSLNDALNKFYGVENGALVQDVQKGSPADKAGVRAEDVIVSVSTKKVEDADALRTLAASFPPHTSVKLGVVRNGKPLTLTAQLGDLSSQPSRREQRQEAQSREEHQRLGIAVAPLTDDVREQLRLPASVQGVVIADVVDDSPADRAGLQRGDVIERIDRTAVHSLDDLRSALNNLDKRDSVVLKIRRGNDERIVPVMLKDE